MADANTPCPEASIAAREDRVRSPASRGREAAGSVASHAWVRALAEAEGPGILRMLCRLLGNEQDAMDAYQETFCKLAALGAGSVPEHARAYAYRTAVNAAAEMVRSRSRAAGHRAAVQHHAVQVVERRDSGRPEDADPGDAAALRHAIAHLPAHLRNVVVLRDLSRLSYERIGQMLSIAPATARVYRRHAVVKLAEILEANA